MDGQLSGAAKAHRRHCLMHRLPQADNTDRQLYDVKSISGTAIANIIGPQVSIQNVGRAGEGIASCATFPGVDSATTCQIKTVSLTTATGPSSGWFLEDAGAPGFV